MKNLMTKARKGFSLVELLIAVVVLGILGAMLIAAGTAAQNKARISVASNDIDSARNAVYTALMMNPSVAQYTDSSTGWNKAVVDLINAELDETWEWEVIGSTDHSGPVAQTKTMRDPWKNPYTMYLYNDVHTTCYNDENGKALTAPDSSLTLVIVSAGPNGTGVGKGLSGEIANVGGTLASETELGSMVNNTDGIDDIGVIMQLVNGSTTQATFGWGSATFGTLEGVNWYFCHSNGVTGKASKLAALGKVDTTAITAQYGSSLKQYPTYEKLPTEAQQAAKNKTPYQVVGTPIA